MFGCNGFLGHVYFFFVWIVIIIDHVCIYIPRHATVHMSSLMYYSLNVSDRKLAAVFQLYNWQCI